MMDSWEIKTLGEIYDIEGGRVQTGPFGSQLHESDYKDSGVAVIMPKDIKDDRLDISNIARISDVDANRLKKHIVEVNDIIFPRRGDIAKRIIINPEQAGSFCGTGCIKLRGTGKILDPEYLFYYLKQKSIIFWIEQQAVGATMLNLNTSILRSVPIILPPLKTQRKIASILSAYDNLIENNLKRIKLLEEQAQQTYEEWFVRFKFPGYENVEFDAISGLPVGWEKVKASKKIKLISGFAFKGKEFTDTPNNDIAVRMGNFKVGGGLKFEKSKYLIDSSAVKEKFHLNHNDLLMVLSDVTREGLLIGNVGFLPKDGRKYYLNQRVSKVEVEDNFKMYAYAVFNSFSFKQNCISKANSVTVLNLKNDDIYGFKMLIPSKNTIELWNKIYGSSIQMSQNLERKNQLLKEARDILLPRLMTGMIDPSASSGQVVESLGSNNYR